MKIQNTQISTIGKLYPNISTIFFIKVYVLFVESSFVIFSGISYTSVGYHDCANGFDTSTADVLLYVSFPVFGK